MKMGEDTQELGRILPYIFNTCSGVSDALVNIHASADPGFQSETRSRIKQGGSQNMIYRIDITIDIESVTRGTLSRRSPNLPLDR